MFKPEDISVTQLQLLPVRFSVVELYFCTIIRYSRRDGEETVSFAVMDYLELSVPSFKTNLRSGWPPPWRNSDNLLAGVSSIVPVAIDISGPPPPLQSEKCKLSGGPFHESTLLIKWRPMGARNVVFVSLYLEETPTDICHAERDDFKNCTSDLAPSGSGSANMPLDRNRCKQREMNSWQVLRKKKKL